MGESEKRREIPWLERREIKVTIKELFVWAENNNCLDCDICVQYRDDGGMYSGMDYDIHPTLEETARENSSSKNIVVL